MSEKRDELETVATRSVQKNGLRGLSFRTLADEVGIKSASVHYYFPEKSHLAQALIDRYSDRFDEALRDIDARRSTPKAKLEAFVKLFETVLEQDRFCLCGMMAAEVEALSEDNRDALSRYFKRTEEWLTKVISEAEAPMKPRSLARIILAGMEGALLIDRVEGRRDQIRAQKELIRQMVG